MSSRPEIANLMVAMVQARDGCSRAPQGQQTCYTHGEEGQDQWQT